MTTRNPDNLISSSADSFALGLIQLCCSDQRESNLKNASNLILEAKGKGAQVICLPELFASRYFCSCFDHSFFDLAEPLDGPTLTHLRQLAAKEELVIVAPFFEKQAAGIYYNSTAVIDSSGELLGVYRKMHIPDDPLYYEKFYFTPGNVCKHNGGSGYQVFKTQYGNLGILICWDQWYPEAARITSLLGADVLIYPTAIGWHPKEKAQWGEKQLDAWQTIQRGHAIANGVYVAAINRIGFEPTPGTDGIEFFGSSFVADPFGSFLHKGSTDREEVSVVKCSRRLIEEQRRHWPFLRDRRIDSYKPITKRWLADNLNG